MPIRLYKRGKPPFAQRPAISKHCGKYRNFQRMNSCRRRIRSFSRQCPHRQERREDVNAQSTQHRTTISIHLFSATVVVQMPRSSYDVRQWAARSPFDTLVELANGKLLVMVSLKSTRARKFKEWRRPFGLLVMTAVCAV